MTRSNKNAESLKIGDLVSIFKRGRMWYANYQTDGQQHRTSLKTQIKKEALKRATELECRLQEGKTPRRILKVSVHQACDEFLNHVTGAGSAPTTIVHYRSALTLLLQFLGTVNVLLISRIDLPLVDDFQKWLLRRPELSAKTVNFKLGVVRGLVLFACRRKYLDANPLAGLRIAKAKASPQPFWTWEQVLAILAAAPSEFRPLFTLLAYTGMRIAEAVHLEWSDVDFVTGAIHIRVKPDWKPKSGEARVVKMANQLAIVLRQQKKTQNWLIPRRATRIHQGPCVAETVRRDALTALKDTLKQLGLTGHHHTFRHSFISHALTNGTPEAIVRSWVGHLDPAITRIYTHVADKISTSQMNDLFDGLTENTAG